jgi:hypothetical protein
MCGKKSLYCSTFSKVCPVRFAGNIELREIARIGQQANAAFFHPSIFLLAGLIRNFKEALIKSAAVDGERFFVKTRFEKRWNTVCISRFSNRRIGGKDPSSAVGNLFRGSLRRKFEERLRRFWRRSLFVSRKQPAQCRWL